MTSSQSTRIQVLDSCRGIAALMVVIYHVPIIFGSGIVPTSDNQYVQIILDFVLISSRLGEQAVFFFMCLSGFVLTQFAHGKAYTFTKWIIWRMLRLEPVYYASLVLALITFHETNSKIRISDLIQTFIFSDTTIYSGPVPPLWSLVVELLVSIIFIRFILSNANFSTYNYYLLTFGYLLGYLIPSWGLKALFRSAIFFIIGVQLNRLYRSGRKLVKARVLYIISLVTVLGSMVSSQVTTLLQVFGIPALIMAVVWTTPQLLNCAPLKLLGKISFSLYASHWVVLIVCRDFFATNPTSVPAIWIISILMCCTIALLFMLLVETPTRALAKRVLKE